MTGPSQRASPALNHNNSNGVHLHPGSELGEMLLTSGLQMGGSPLHMGTFHRHCAT